MFSREEIDRIAKIHAEHKIAQARKYQADGRLLFTPHRYDSCDCRWSPLGYGSEERLIDYRGGEYMFLVVPCRSSDPVAACAEAIEERFGEEIVSIDPRRTPHEFFDTCVFHDDRPSVWAAISEATFYEYGYGRSLCYAADVRAKSPRHPCCVCGAVVGEGTQRSGSEAVAARLTFHEGRLATERVAVCSEKCFSELSRQGEELLRWHERETAALRAGRKMLKALKKYLKSRSQEDLDVLMSLNGESVTASISQSS